MKIPLYQVDAFARHPFTGNPAAVCPLDSWLPDHLLQSIAAENNLADTAFFVPGEGDVFRLRWFTPTTEVDLCGHATLASAYVLMNEWRPGLQQVEFETASGRLTVRRKGDLYELDFPARPPIPCEAHQALVPALGITPIEILGSRDYVVVYESEEQIRALRPNMAALMDIDRFAVIVTAPGHTADFVSRFFAPAQGIPEDPVTGSAHCSLVPYWAQRLGRDSLQARQLSARTGELWCELHSDRVRIAGHAALYLKGEIDLHGVFVAGQG